MTDKNTTASDMFAPDEIQRLRVAAKCFDAVDVCIMLALYTGLVQGEVCGLKWGDIDLDNRLIRIRRTMAREPNPSGRPKTILKERVPRCKRALRDIPVPDELAEQLRLMKRIHTDDEYVLVGVKGGVEPNNLASHFFTGLLDRAGVRHRPFSALRKTYARSCYNKGMNAEKISALLGEPDAEYTAGKHLQE